jgi:hypothetical protein
MADVGAERRRSTAAHVITRYRSSATNLRSQLNRIIRRAGLVPWEKTFVNMRSSRQTELSEEFPVQCVCQWIGNSPAVARQSYLQVTSGHLARAIAWTAGSGDVAAAGAGTTGGVLVEPSPSARDAGQRGAGGANVAGAVTGGEAAKDAA